MSETPRYSSLRDYLALLRRQRWVVLAITVAFGGAALGLSTSQTETYEAESAVQFRDISEDARILGDFGGSEQNFLQKAAVEAEDVTSLSNAERVKKQLETRSTPTELQNAVTARVDVQTGFVVIESSWDDARFAADVANAFAEVAAADAVREVRAQLDGAIERLEKQADQPVTTDEPGVVDLEVVSAQQQLVALRNLREIVEPAEVAVTAEVPGSPASPKTTRNVILGSIIGFALGLLAAFVRDSLDRRLRTPKDVHDQLGYPVLGRVGLTAMGSAGVASNGKTFVSPADLEAFRILRTNMAVLDLENPPRSVLVTSGLPEEGKSTVAAALASAAAAAGQRVLLVEADLRRPVLATRMDVNAGPGLTEYLLGQAEPSEVLQVLDVPAARSGNGSGVNEAVGRQSLVCITAGTPPEHPAELLASERCRSFVSKVTKAYDLVVFDSSPMLSTADPLELMPQMGSVLLCVRLSRSTHEEVKAVGSAMDLLPERPVGIVVTGIGVSDGYYGDYTYA